MRNYNRKRHLAISESIVNGQFKSARTYCNKTIEDQKQLAVQLGIEIQFFRKYEEKEMTFGDIPLNYICGNCYRIKNRKPYTMGHRNWNHIIKYKTPVLYIMQYFNCGEQTAQLIKMIAIANEPGFMLRIMNEKYDSYGRNINQLKMAALNRVLEGFGVDSIIVPGSYVDNYWLDNNGLYVNQGDTYSKTIVFDTENGNYICTSWGDFYETLESRLEIR